MKKLIIFYLLSVISLEIRSATSAVTYLISNGNGRLGDMLFCYCKAKWISYKYNIPLYYRPFEYSDKFFLSHVDRLYYNAILDKLQHKRLRGKTRDQEQDPKNFIYINQSFDDANTLYVIDASFFVEQWKHLMFDNSNVIHPYNISYNKDYIQQGKNRYQFRHDEAIIAFKQDPKFIEELRKVIKPIEKIKAIKKPKGIVSVAVHVRIGGGFDGPHVSPFFYESNPELNRYIDFIEGQNNNHFYTIQRQIRDKTITKIPINSTELDKRETESDVLRPLKHAPMQFYVDQIKGLSAMLKDIPLFVFIFTDQPNPCEIKKKFEKLINKKNITFACREKDNRHNLNVLEDLFSMSEFDCLIRPYSSFSQVAELIGNHKIVIMPYHSIWYKGNLIIDEIKIMIYDKNFINKL